MPENGSYANIFIIDPKGKHWPQNSCNQYGRTICKLKPGENTFRIFLHNSNKQVRAYLAYYYSSFNGDISCGRSEIFIIPNPDAK
ncbi:MAG: hypothetical protein ABIH50_06340 [bacterium]